MVGEAVAGDGADVVVGAGFGEGDVGWGCGHNGTKRACRSASVIVWL